MRPGWAKTSLFLLSVTLVFGALAVTRVAPAEAGSVPVVGTVDGTPKVTVNGKPVTPSQPAFPGDVIEVPNSDWGTIRFPENGMARLSYSARATVERSGKELWVGLQRGFVGIHEGAQIISVRAHGGLINGPSGAVFEVAQVNDQTTVTAVKGNAVLTQGGLPSAMTVAEGKSVKVAFLEPGPLGYDPQAGSQPKGDKKSQQAKAVCNDPCKKDKSSKECEAFNKLKKECTPLRKSCASDPKSCPEYGQKCRTLAGCAGYGGVAEASAIGATGAVGSATASAAASAAASAGASVAASAGAVAASAAAATTAAVVPAAVGASAAAGGATVVVATVTNAANCPAGTTAVPITGGFNCVRQINTLPSCATVSPGVPCQ